jgi:hypothetical protein
MKPKLKPPGTERLKLKCDILLSTSAFKFNVRRCTKADLSASIEMMKKISEAAKAVATKAGAYTRSRWSST